VLSRLGGTLLGNRDMRLFLAAQGLDSLAIGVAGVALPWLLLSEGHSVGLASLVYPLTIVPFVVFGLPAGALGDRFPWRRVMYASHSFQAAASASIPLWAVGGSPPLALVLTAALLVGAGRVFSDAAAFGAVASVVGPGNFTRGQSALSAVWSIGFFAGPALAGLLVAAVGPSFALAAEASALVIASVLIAAVRTGRTSPASSPAGYQDVRAGLRFIHHDPAVRVFTITSFGFVLVTAGAVGLQVPLLRNTIGLTSIATGWTLALGALTGTAASLATSKLGQRIGPSLLYVAAMVLAAAALAGLATASGLPAAVLAFMAYSGVSWLLSTLLISERQRRAPAELQARVGIAGRMLLLGAVVAGSALATALAGKAGIRATYLVMAVAAAVIAIAVASPLIRRASLRGSLVTWTHRLKEVGDGRSTQEARCRFPGGRGAAGPGVAQADRAGGPGPGHQRGHPGHLGERRQAAPQRWHRRAG
jgi:MFS family permease